MSEVRTPHEDEMSEGTPVKYLTQVELDALRVSMSGSLWFDAQKPAVLSGDPQAIAIHNGTIIRLKK